MVINTTFHMVLYTEWDYNVSDCFHVLFLKSSFVRARVCVCVCVCMCRLTSPCMFCVGLGFVYVALVEILHTICTTSSFWAILPHTNLETTLAPKWKPA